MPLRIPIDTLEKLQAKLRMIADGDTTVNVVRSERSAALAVRQRNAAIAGAHFAAKGG